MNVEFLNKHKPAHHALRLKKNLIVIMCLKNLSIKYGLCNGTRPIIVRIENNVFKCKILTGNKPRRETVCIPRFTLIDESTRKGVH